jgi:hypothetical protein
MSGMVLNALCSWFPLILTAALSGKCFYHPYLIVKEFGQGPSRLYLRSGQGSAWRQSCLLPDPKRESFPLSPSWSISQL